MVSFKNEIKDIGFVDMLANNEPNFVFQGCDSDFSRKRLFFFPGCDRCCPFFYVLINKNACTGFKSFFREHSPHLDRRIEEDSGNFMRRCHLADWRDLRRADFPTFVVVRDPSDRIASCFIDRLVRLGGEGGGRGLSQDIFHSLAVAPTEMTFRDFVLNYVLASKPSSLNPHVRPQSHHLPPGSLRLIYLSKLDSYLSALTGFDLLASFLRDHRNRTSEFVTIHASPNQKVAELHELFLTQAVLPSPDSLLSDDLRTEIAKTFAHDAALVALSLQV